MKYLSMAVFWKGYQRRLSLADRGGSDIELYQTCFPSRIIGFKLFGFGLLVVSESFMTFPDTSAAYLQTTRSLAGLSNLYGQAV